MGGAAWKDILCDPEENEDCVSGSLCLCRCIENERADDATYDINASIVELYNEQVQSQLALECDRKIPFQAVGTL